MMMRSNLLLIVLSLIVSKSVCPNPIIIKLSQIYPSTNSLAIKFLDKETFIFGKFIDEDPNKIEVHGVPFSFKDFRKQKQYEKRVISRDGILPIDVTSHYVGDNKDKEYDIRVIGTVIKIVQDERASYFTLQLAPNRGVSVQVNEDLSPDGIPYIYEPKPGDCIYYPSSLWNKRENQKAKYLRSAIHSYEWQSQTADQNYELIISDKDITKHFDILFGEGLLEYLIKRNAEESITDEKIFGYRQMQTLILSYIVANYNNDITVNYPDVFEIAGTYKNMERIIENPRYMDWYKSAEEEIREKLREFRDNLPKK